MEAYIWNKNGDIPNEVTEVFKSGKYAGELYEGSVVRYFRHPNIDGNSICALCNKPYHDHGWIDQDEEGITVCPGSYVVKHSNVEYSVYSPEVFAKNFEMVDRRTPMFNHTFQERAYNFFSHCFQDQFPKLTNDPQENQHRFLEESLEFVQALGMTQAEALALVDYVFNRTIGDPALEAGGVCTTLAILAKRYNIDINEAAENELKRNYVIVDKIRDKQRLKDQLRFKELRSMYEKV